MHNYLMQMAAGNVALGHRYARHAPSRESSLCTRSQVSRRAYVCRAQRSARRSVRIRDNEVDFLSGPRVVHLSAYRRKRCPVGKRHLGMPDVGTGQRDRWQWLAARTLASSAKGHDELSGLRRRTVHARQPRDEMQVAFAKPIDPRHDGVDAARCACALARFRQSLALRLSAAKSPALCKRRNSSCNLTVRCKPADRLRRAQSRREARFSYSRNASASVCFVPGVILPTLMSCSVHVAHATASA
ncbi:Uncharacterised protein [Pandoraea pulmonicola]|uniref:Uncharacterized protein n=1 Tax=Pandoraea pulmonicola TaxID=93221 RepID=A0AAJ4ZEQ6_PANPU|nr:Uncharacterised protein [Pandoraea pulmonicola]